jgi:hypothetical protein
MGGFLVIKLVKPTKVFGSWPPDEGGFDQLRFIQAQPEISTAAARVLGEANATVGQELCRLDLADALVNQFAELPPLFVADGGMQVLDLDQSFAHEYDLRDFGNSGDPGVADQLRVERQQAIGFFRVAGRGGLPFQ